MPAVETSGGHSVLKNTFAPTASGGKSKSLALKRGGGPWTVLTVAPAAPLANVKISVDASTRPLVHDGSQRSVTLKLL